MPCRKCGVNDWTDCKHRKAERAEPVFKNTVDRRGEGGGTYRVSPERLRQYRDRQNG